MIHALTLLCVLLFAAPLASYIPMAALAGILMVVSYNMGEWREIPQLLRLTKTDISVWLVTFALTVFADLTVAVEAGMILAALLFIARVAETTTVSQVTGDYVEDGRLHILQDKEIPYYATIFRIHGPFLFGATDKISAVTGKMHELPPIVIIRLRNMTAIDATGLFALEEIAKQLHATKRTLILCGAREQPAQMIHQGEFEEVVGRENICANVQEALRRAEAVFEKIEARAAVSGKNLGRGPPPCPGPAAAAGAGPPPHFKPTTTVRTTRGGGLGRGGGPPYRKERRCPPPPSKGERPGPGQDCPTPTPQPPPRYPEAKGGGGGARPQTHYFPCFGHVCLLKVQLKQRNYSPRRRDIQFGHRRNVSRGASVPLMHPSREWTRAAAHCPHRDGTCYCASFTEGGP